MEHLTETQLIISVIFAAVGFIIAYYTRVWLSFVIFIIFLYAALKSLEKLNYHPDWDSFDKFVSVLQQLEKSMLVMMHNMVSTAGTLSIMLFLFGGVVGLIMSRRSA